MATDSQTDTEYRSAVLKALELALKHEDTDLAEALTDFAEKQGWQEQSAKSIAANVRL